MSFSWAFQWYHFHLDPIWPDGTFKLIICFSSFTHFAIPIPNFSHSCFSFSLQFVLILLSIYPHSPLNVSSFSFKCILILLSIYPHSPFNLSSFSFSIYPHSLFNLSSISLQFILLLLSLTPPSPFTNSVFFFSNSSSTFRNSSFSFQ